MSKADTPAEKAREFDDIHSLLHKLWTKATGQDDYVKSDWIVLEAMIARTNSKAADAWKELTDSKTEAVSLHACAADRADNLRELSMRLRASETLAQERADYMTRFEWLRSRIGALLGDEDAEWAVIHDKLKERIEQERVSNLDLTVKLQQKTEELQAASKLFAAQLLEQTAPAGEYASRAGYAVTSVQRLRGYIRKHFPDVAREYAISDDSAHNVFSCITHLLGSMRALPEEEPKCK